MSLFRKEAVTHHQERLIGSVVLTQPLSIKLVVAALVFIVSVILVFISTAEYTRKEIVRGYLTPSEGVLKSFASQGGTIEKLWVEEGSLVEKGQKLATVIIHQNSADGDSLSAELVEKYIEQLTLLDEEVMQLEELQSRQMRDLEDEKASLLLEKNALLSQISLIEEKLKLLLSRQDTMEALNKDGYLSKFDEEEQRSRLLEVKQEKENYSRLIIQQLNKIAQIDAKRIILPKEFILKANNLLRQKAEIESKLSQVKNNYRYIVTANNSGVVTSIQVFEGETLSPSKAQIQPILHILPKGAELVAELLLPTRSAGFIEHGQVSRLRFDAFPFQRFGYIESKIVRVDRSLIFPNENQFPITLNEPVYRIRAKLRSQHISAYGQSFNLKSGMIFEADIILEKQTLLRWLFEPLYSLKGRLS
ncbi:HlyD family efflux transporter periplasmic adaptor subunit [Alteromonas macleodii]|uniref:HlyD family efflux transporter periplasmic adaptor subunit n=1 Tax=Alteromonas macleodii TaxID=28108 RepID=UPI0020768252|nr:HlyD family efflux transporter periplasmic adaptor subunit [Alteromonas macleodii]USI29021.1 HlyD family secretion protein [Alteromonas macleodii]